MLVRWFFIHFLFTPSQNEDTKGFPFNRPGMLTAPRVTTHPFHDWLMQWTNKLHHTVSSPSRSRCIPTWCFFPNDSNAIFCHFASNLRLITWRYSNYWGDTRNTTRMYSFLLCVMQQPTDSCFFLSCRILILFLQQLELLVVKREMSQIENEKGLELGVIRYQVSSTGIKERVELKYALVHISLRISFF